jgi:hypothetical protein
LQFRRTFASLPNRLVWRAVGREALIAVIILLSRVAVAKLAKNLNFQPFLVEDFQVHQSNTNPIFIISLREQLHYYPFLKKPRLNF